MTNSCRFWNRKSIGRTFSPRCRRAAQNRWQSWEIRSTCGRAMEVRIAAGRIGTTSARGVGAAEFGGITAGKDLPHRVCGPVSWSGRLYLPGRTGVAQESKTFGSKYVPCHRRHYGLDFRVGCADRTVNRFRRQYDFLRPPRLCLLPDGVRPTPPTPACDPGYRWVGRATNDGTLSCFWSAKPNLRA
jgi:hypothetical protein